MGIKEAMITDWLGLGAAVIGTRAKTKVPIYLEESKLMLVRDRRVMVKLVL